MAPLLCLGLLGLAEPASAAGEQFWGWQVAGNFYFLGVHPCPVKARWSGVTTSPDLGTFWFKIYDCPADGPVALEHSFTAKKLFKFSTANGCDFSHGYDLTAPPETQGSSDPFQPMYLEVQVQLDDCEKLVRVTVSGTGGGGLYTANGSCGWATISTCMIAPS